MLRSYEAWDPMEQTLDRWAEQWPVSKQSFYSAMRAKGLQPKSQRPATPARGIPEVHGATAQLVELLLDCRLRVRFLEARLREAGLPTD